MTDNQLGQYREDMIKAAKAELAKSPSEQHSHRKLFAASIVYRLEGIIGDMLEKPQNTADFATALYQFVLVRDKLRAEILEDE